MNPSFTEQTGSLSASATASNSAGSMRTLIICFTPRTLTAATDIPFYDDWHHAVGPYPAVYGQVRNER